MVASRLVGVLFLLVVLVLGILIGFGFSFFVDLSKVSMDEEVDFYASRFRVEVVDTGESRSFSLDDPLVKVIYYQKGGVLLSENQRRQIEWQVVLGLEEAPYEGKGDSCDVILKLIKYSDGTLEYQVCCFGNYMKRVYYGDKLLLDTSLIQFLGNPRYASGKLP